MASGWVGGLAALEAGLRNGDARDLQALALRARARNMHKSESTDPGKTAHQSRSLLKQGASHSSFKSTCLPLHLALFVPTSVQVARSVD